MERKKHTSKFTTIKFYAFYLILLLFSYQILPAQEATNYTYYDTLTYRLYTQSKWDSLIFTGNEAINHGIDYYYLRMRLGVAYYSLGKYSDASQHFEKANELNSNSVVLEYLYNSYLYGNDFRKALYLTKQMPNELSKKLSAQRPHFFDEINVEYTNCAVNNWNNVKTEDTPPSTPNNYRLEKDITGPFTSYTVNLYHELSKKWTWYNSLDYFDVLSYQQLYFDKAIQHQTDYHLYEYHYYTSLTNWKNSNSSWTFFAHFSSINANKYDYNFVHPVLAPPPLPPITTYIYNIQPINYSVFNYLIGIQKSYYHPKSSTQISLGFARVINDTIAFAGLSVNYRLIKNYLSGKSTLTGSSDFTNKAFNGYVQQSLSLNLFRKLNIETSYIYGKIQNMASPDGTILYNTPYQINYKWVNLLKYAINRHASVYISYIFQNNSVENDFLGFARMGKQNQVIYSLSKINYNFNSQIILGGILWNI